VIPVEVGEEAALELGELLVRYGRVIIRAVVDFPMSSSSWECVPVIVRVVEDPTLRSRRSESRAVVSAARPGSDGLGEVRIGGIESAARTWLEFASRARRN